MPVGYCMIYEHCSESKAVAATSKHDGMDLNAYKNPNLKNSLKCLPLL